MSPRICSTGQPLARFPIIQAGFRWLIRGLWGEQNVSIAAFRYADLTTFLNPALLVEASGHDHRPQPSYALVSGNLFTQESDPCLRYLRSRNKPAIERTMPAT